MSDWRLHYHLIWATKQRLPLIGSEEEAVIRESLEMTMARMKLIGHAIGLVADHVHVALSIPPTVSVADAMGRLKGGSSHLVGQRLPTATGFAWQAEYGALSLTERALPTVIEYVQHQKHHHAANTLIQGLSNVSSPEVRARDPQPTRSDNQPASAGFRSQPGSSGPGHDTSGDGLLCYRALLPLIPDLLTTHVP